MAKYRLGDVPRRSKLRFRATQKGTRHHVGAQLSAPDGSTREWNEIEDKTLVVRLEERGRYVLAIVAMFLDDPADIIRVQVWVDHPDQRVERHWDIPAKINSTTISTLSVHVT